MIEDLFPRRHTIQHHPYRHTPTLPSRLRYFILRSRRAFNPIQLPHRRGLRDRKCLRCQDTHSPNLSGPRRLNHSTRRSCSFFYIANRPDNPPCHLRLGSPLRIRHWRRYGYTTSYPATSCRASGLGYVCSSPPPALYLPFMDLATDSVSLVFFF